MAAPLHPLMNPDIACVLLIPLCLLRYICCLYSTSKLGSSQTHLHIICVVFFALGITSPFQQATSRRFAVICPQTHVFFPLNAIFGTLRADAELALVNDVADEDDAHFLIPMVTYIT